MSASAARTATALMAGFVSRTGLGASGGTSRRYLWTDAHAVCTLLELGDFARAIELVEHVHHALGRHRGDDPRRGWISGLSEADGERHPTIGGLRIGKPLSERPANEPYDARHEWERDGQYFHYLTKWMHALDQIAHATGDTRYARWARELAETAHRRFVHDARDGHGMDWKRSIDLARPQVASMGQHDPLDGYVTSLQLDLVAAATDYGRMIDADTLATADPLGLGGLLVDAYRLMQLARDRPLRETLLAAARLGLDHYVQLPDLRLPADRRFAFRELGLAIGLAAVDAMSSDRFARYAPVRAAIETFWLDAEHRASPSYREHADINDVMLATALAPRGFLVLALPAKESSRHRVMS